MSTDSIVSFKAVASRLGLSRAQIYAMVAYGDFPRPVRLSERRVGFVALDIDLWLERRIAARDAVEMAA